MNDIKNIFFCLLVFIGTGCKHESITGEWLVKDHYHKATYAISNDTQKGLVLNVLHYNDGTMTYEKGEVSPFFSEVKLCKQKEKYVDCSSGATALKGKPNIAITVVNKDSLKVEKRISNQIITEFWKKK